MASGLLQISHKLNIWWWRHNLLTSGYRKIFWRFHLSLITFSYWSKFYVSIITGSVVATIFIYKGFLPLGELRIPNLAPITNKERKQGHATRKSTEKLSLRTWKRRSKNAAKITEQGCKNKVEINIKKYLMKKRIWKENI